MAKSLDDAANAATKVTNETEEDLNSSEETSEETDETSETDEVDEEEPEESDNDEEAQKAQAALNLYNALNDPEQGRLVLKYLAEQAGLLEGSTAEKKEAVKDWLDELKEVLGDDDAHLVGPLAKILNRFVFAESNKIRKEAQDQLNQFRQEVAQERLKEGLQTFYEKNEVSEAEARSIDELAKKLAPAKGVSFNAYMSNLLTIVRSEGVEKTKKANTINKQAINLKKRLPQGVEGRTERIVRDNSKPIDLDEAVRRAVEQTSGRR